MEAAAGTEVARPGLRERKKQQTRDRIARVGLDLFAKRGYNETTLAEIAEAADVSTRTIFAYYQSKEDILFCDEPAFYERLRLALEERPEGTSTLDALRDFIVSAGPPDKNARLRKKIVADDEGLRLAGQARYGRMTELIASSIAEELDAPPGDVRPQLVAASMATAFETVHNRLVDESGGEPPSHEKMIALLDEVLDFLRGGLDALRRD